MRARERPACSAVIKSAWIPRRGVVACGAQRSRKSRGHVVRNGAAKRLCAEPFIRVAAVTIRVGTGQAVVVVDMAGSAGGCKVKARKRPTGRAVIKICRAPASGGVAGRAVRQRERRAGCGMHGSGRLLPGDQVAARGAAGRWRNLQIIVVGGMAVRARGDLSGRRELMQILQGEAGGIVAPGRSPVCGGVATGALRRREPSCDVIWNRTAHRCRAVVLILVAAVAICVRCGKGIVVIEMAGRARRSQVNARERPASRAVVKCRRIPGNRVVTR